VKGGDGRWYGYPNCPVYTTNYDLVLETHWQGGVHINDLWVNRSGVEVLDVTKKEGEIVDLIKLHGSLNWFKVEGGDIVKLESYKRKFAKKRVRGDVMIYPIYQKDLYLYPWFDLFKRFKEDLDDTKNWVAIGYNFNDEFIRNIVHEIMEKGGHRLIVVSPHANEIIKEKFGKYRESVRCIKARFGEEQTNSMIVDELY
jgi:hypothetical protein